MSDTTTDPVPVLGYAAGAERPKARILADDEVERMVAEADEEDDDAADRSDR